ncbi:DUF1772 domain-containing protein [Oerskovia flava]|uniref:anthrone oxygenase family protein n=1 Tax=Oerskovia flava TaxID=2986422 RepID=UPI00223F5D92|nr:anthrone oxygenase family protein [Oerskovia sp. JB1-3-2]
MSAVDADGWLVLVACVGSGLSAGVLFAFSTFVGAGLRAAGPTHGAWTMAMINRTAMRPPLMLLLGGTALVSIASAVVALASGRPGAVWTVVGAASYLLGAVLVTGAANVPLNDRLEVAARGVTQTGTAQEEGPTAALATFWPAFLARWLPWNHVRTVVCTFAAAAFAIALAP